MPVVPAVYSTTVPRGESRPSAAAHSIIALAMRSFILPVGFADSNLTTSRLVPHCEVQPMECCRSHQESSGSTPVIHLKTMDCIWLLCRICAGISNRQIALHKASGDGSQAAFSLLLGPGDLARVLLFLFYHSG